MTGESTAAGDPPEPPEVVGGSWRVTTGREATVRVVPREGLARMMSRWMGATGWGRRGGDFLERARAWMLQN